MSVLIGSARISETNTINGAKGDQTANECSTQSWYLHKKGWVCIRPKSAIQAAKIAQDMEYICNNNHFGYGQSDRDSAYEACKKCNWNASMVAKDVNTDCSLSVLICLKYAGIDIPYDSSHPFYTGNIVSRLQETGKFEVFTDDKHCKSEDYLRTGDILCTKTKGHVVVVLSNGAKLNERYKAKTWTRDAKGWWYAKTETAFAKSEWLTINHCKYYFNAEGYAVTGLQKIGGKLYYFEPTVNAEKECALMCTNKAGALEVAYFD